MIRTVCNANLYSWKWAWKVIGLGFFKIIFWAILAIYLTYKVVITKKLIWHSFFYSSTTGILCFITVTRKGGPLPLNIPMLHYAQSLWKPVLKKKIIANALACMENSLMYVCAMRIDDVFQLILPFLNGDEWSTWAYKIKKTIFCLVN